MSLLRVDELTIRYGDTSVVRDLSFALTAGESVGLVGESGSGKTQTGLAILGLLPGSATTQGSVLLNGTEVLGASEKVLNEFAIGAINWLDMARIVRGQTLSLREREFVEAAQLTGVSMPRIILRHIAPNLLGVVVVYVTLTIPQAILVESFLSFLGLGIQEPQTSLGALVDAGVNQMENVDDQVQKYNQRRIENNDTEHQCVITVQRPANKELAEPGYAEDFLDETVLRC